MDYETAIENLTSKGRFYIDLGLDRVKEIVEKAKIKKEEKDTIKTNTKIKFNAFVKKPTIFTQNIK